MTRICARSHCSVINFCREKLRPQVKLETATHVNEIDDSDRIARWLDAVNVGQHESIGLQICDVAMETARVRSYTPM